MFIKVTKSGKYQYAQLVESYRENGATRHKVLLNLGRVDQIANNPSYQNLARSLAKLSNAGEVVNPRDISEAEVFNWGHGVYRKIWDQYGIGTILGKIAAGRRIKYDVDDAAFLMAVQHLLRPRSKLGTFNGQRRYIGLPTVELNHLYRSLDILSECKDALEEELFAKNRNLFNMEVDVVFYDVTTFSFESVRADSLREFGFSKDGKFKEVQVVLGLVTDCEGRPIGYELFPGDTFDGKTMAKALENIRKRFGIRRVVIVADRGLNSKLNLKLIREAGYDYIVAARLKGMKRSVRDSALSPEGYIHQSDEGEEFRYKTLPHDNVVKGANGEVYNLREHLIVSFSGKRARKDRSDRKRLLEKAERLLQNPSQISSSNKRGGKKYLRNMGEEPEWVLDEDAVERDALFDGYYAIQTSALDMTATEIMDAYHKLWKIEESFRIMKSTLEVRPIFHWTESRIKGHFVVCFLAFLLERSLEFRLKRSGEAASPEVIRDALNSLNFARVSLGGEEYLIRTKTPGLANRILRLLGIRAPRNATPATDFTLPQAE